MRSSVVTGLILIALAPLVHAQRGGVLGGGSRARCGDPLAFQVLLDRSGYSPGEIDGRLGANASRAIAAYQQGQDLSPTGRADCATWRQLSADAEPITTDYRVTDEDVAGPFAEAIPEDLERQADLPALSYRSPIERLAERFHAAPSLILSLNRTARIVPGATIRVPAVKPFDADAAAPHGAAVRGVTIEVSRNDSSLRVIGGDGSTLFFAPTTSGSAHDPLPLGRWRVTSIGWHPEFHYNPDLFWDASPADVKATIKPGPNNPVGVVWIGLSVEHYGIHGTPEPSRIGYSQSHGCVRLTNWDAARVASLASVGTPVIFR